MNPSRIARSGTTRLKRRLDALSPSEALRARRDRRRLVERFSWLADYPARSRDVVRRFQGDHRYYVTEVGHPVHAASLELAVFLAVLFEEVRPRRVVDLGSGFSSYVLRRLAVEAGDVEAWSVDDSAEWLGRTRAFLESRGMPVDRLQTWDEFRVGVGGGFDLVLHDMGTMGFRAQTLPDALRLARPGGLVVLDDVHKPAYRAAARRELERDRIEHFSLRPFTIDRLTRYAWLAVA